MWLEAPSSLSLLQSSAWTKFIMWLEPKWNNEFKQNSVSVFQWQVFGGLSPSQRTDAFELWHWRRLLSVPWTPRRSNQSILKEISYEYSLEGLMLKLHYFGHLMRRANSLEKTLMLGKTEGRRRRGTTEDEMVGWHHWLNGHEFEQTLRDSEGQGGLACCSSWGRKELDRT